MKVIGKKFPRIYSISTVGIRNHNNADYLIHPLRTDFTGESTTGKSLIGADIPQLILTAGKYYKRATPPKGGVIYDFNTMPLPTGPNTSLPFAYAFMNIQVDENEFIVIGVQVKHSRRILIPFIIQGEKYLGYGENEYSDFKPLKNIIRYKDFLINDTEMPPIDNLKDHLDRQQIFLKSFHNNELKKEYHKLLYHNEILHLDLSIDESLQEQFANTLQSLSRGEDIETKGMKFKKFLFHYDNKVEDKFNKDSEEIQQSHRDFQSNTQKHFAFTEKKQNLKDLLEKKKEKEQTLEARIKYATAFKHQKVVEQQKLLNEVRESFFQTELETLVVREKKVHLEIEKYEKEIESKTKKSGEYQNDFDKAKSDFDNYTKELESLKTVVPALEIENNKLKIQYDKYQQVENWVNEYSTISNVREKFERQFEINVSKEKLNELNEFLQRTKLMNEFEESEYTKSIHKATEFYLHEKNTLSAQIASIEKLKSIIDKQKPDSFAGWAVSSKRKLNELQESVLFHFASYPVTIFHETEHFIPEPNEFIEALKQVHETEASFVINLSGLHYQIKKRPNYIFGEPDELEKEIKRIGKDYQTEINKLQGQLDTIEKLQQELIQTFKYSEEYLSAYLNREAIQVHKTDNSFLNYTPTLFDKVIEIYQADIKKKEEQKIKTIFEKTNKDYAEKLGRQNIGNEKKEAALTAKTSAEQNIKTILNEIEELNDKIKFLTNITLIEIETSFITWKSNLDNPLKENHEKIFQKFKTNLKSSSMEFLTQKELELAKRIGEEGGRIKFISENIPVFQSAFENQNKEYLKHFQKTI
jgi:DNA repair protein SbcC/Rad50